MGKLRGAYSSLYLSHLTLPEFASNLLLPGIEMLIALGLVFFFSRSIFPACVAFAIYVGYLIQVKVAGGATCNCLGGSVQDVRLVMAIDFVCLGLLLISNPFRNDQRAFLLPSMILCLIPASALFWIFNPGISSVMAESFTPGPLRSDYRPGIRVVSNSNYRSEIKVTNRSRQTLKIKRILASCDCTKLTPDSLELGPGESKTLQIAIDLNKSYKPRQSSARHQFTAACYDDKDDLIDQITLFQGESFRSFAIDAGRRVHEWKEGEANELEIPIDWISNSKSPVECMIDGEVVATASFPHPLKVHVNRPVSYFEKKRMVFARTEKTDRMELELDLSVVTKPGNVTVNFRDAENIIELSGKDKIESVDVRVCNLDGQLINNAKVSPDDILEGSFRVPAIQEKGSCFFDLSVTEQSKPSHRIVIPFYSEGTLP